MDISSINNSAQTGHIQTKAAVSGHKERTDKGQDIAVKKDMSEGEAPARQVGRILQDLKLDNVMKIGYSKELDRIIVQVLDGGTNVVKRQIPSEDFIAFLSKFKQIVMSAI